MSIFKLTICDLIFRLPAEAGARELVIPVARCKSCAAKPLRLRLSPAQEGAPRAHRLGYCKACGITQATEVQETPEGEEEA